VSRWFIENALLLNPTKTEAVVSGTSQRLSQVNKSQWVWVAEAHVQFTDAVKLLAVTLDSTLSFDKHIIDVTRSCHYHIRAMRHIRPILTLDAAKAMAVVSPVLKSNLLPNSTTLRKLSCRRGTARARYVSFRTTAGPRKIPLENTCHRRMTTTVARAHWNAAVQ